MVSINLNERSTAILMIIIGVIALAFPLISTATIGIIAGGIVLILAIGLLVRGIAEYGYNKMMSIVNIFFAILCLIFAYELIFDPAFVSAIIGVLIYVFGFLLVVLGVIGLISGSGFAPFSLIGLTTLIFGIITIIVGLYIQDPRVLGTIIGIWLIVSGFLSLFTNKDNNIINL